MNDAAVTRFWSKVDRPVDGCWEWKAGKFRYGYGAFSLKEKLLKAHRVSYELAYGPIPEGMYVCHHCDNPPCVNPTHLFIGTPQDNMTDKIRKGRLVACPGERNGMWGVRKTHCKQGHELTGDNVYVNKGQRHCQACRRERIAVWNAKLSEERRIRRGQGKENVS